MKKLVILCLMFLAFGLCSSAFAANGAGEGPRGRADRVEAAEEKAEEAKSRAEAEKEKTEGEAAKAEEAKQKAEAEAAKAETARQKAETAAEKAKEGRDVAEDAGEKAKKEMHAAGKGRMGAVERQMVHEQEKHKNRVARLTRIKELAQQEGDAKAVARVDKLMADESKRHAKKMGELEGRRGDGQGKAAGAAEKAGKANTGKGAGR